MKSAILIVSAVAFVAASVSGEQFQLTVNTTGNGIVDPNSGTYEAGTVVTIKAWPAAGECIKAWTGTDNDWSTELTNTVTMTSDKIVIVEFGPAIMVNRPAAGDVWTSGSIHKIAWSSYGAGAVDILFSKNGGTSWQAIDGGVPDTGSRTWHLPSGIDSSQCLILIVPSIPDANVLCMKSGAFTIHPDSPGPPVVSKWRTLGGDFERRGLSENYGPELGCVKWKFETNGAIVSSVTIGFDGRVHVPCEDGKLYTLDPNGVLLWSYDANSPLVSSPSIGGDGTVYVGAKNGKLYAIDIDGNLRWTHSTDGPVSSSPAVSADGKVYVGSQDGKLYALGRDGSELWSFETDGITNLGGAVFASPTIGHDGSIYIGGLYDPNLYALDANDGSVKWVCHFESGGWPFASPVVAEDGTVYQTLLYDSHLYAIKPDEPNAGSIIWSADLANTDSGLFDPYKHWGYEIWRGCGYREADYNDVSNSAWTEPVIGPDGTLYVSFDDPYLRLIDPNGSIKWITRLGRRNSYIETDGPLGWGSYRQTPETISGVTLTIGSDGLIYAAGDDGYLYVVNADGRRVARFENDNWAGFPVISGNNTFIVADSRDNTTLINYANNAVRAISGDACQGQELDLCWYGIQDINGDAKVDFEDFALFAADWLRWSACTDRRSRGVEQMFLMGDVNKDRYVDFGDLATLADEWLRGY